MFLNFYIFGRITLIFLSLFKEKRLGWMANIGCPKSRDAFLKDYSTKSIVSVVKIFDGKVEKES